MDAHPANVEAEIRRLSDQAEPLVARLAKQARDAAEAEAAYRVGYARAMLASEMKTVSDREAQATIACEDLLLKRKIAEALADTTKEAGRMLRAQLDALRSINANARQAAGLS